MCLVTAADLAPVARGIQTCAQALGGKAELRLGLTIALAVQGIWVEPCLLGRSPSFSPTLK